MIEVSHRFLCPPVTVYLSVDGKPVFDVVLRARTSYEFKGFPIGSTNQAGHSDFSSFRFAKSTPTAGGPGGAEDVRHVAPTARNDWLRVFMSSQVKTDAKVGLIELQFKQFDYDDDDEDVEMSAPAHISAHSDSSVRPLWWSR